MGLCVGGGILLCIGTGVLLGAVVPVEGDEGDEGDPYPFAISFFVYLLLSCISEPIENNSTLPLESFTNFTLA